MGNDISIFAPDDDQCGPAMRVLTRKQRAFVVAMLETGSNDHTRCARLAGYEATTDHSFRQCGWVAAHNPRVQAAIHEEAEKRLGAAKVMAVSQLIAIAEKSNDERTRLKAFSMILNRTGMHEKTEHKVQVTHENEGDTIARIMFLANALGIDGQKLIGSATPKTQLEAIDVPFEETPSLEDIL